jgi:hypothetical protein
MVVYQRQYPRPLVSLHLIVLVWTDTIGVLGLISGYTGARSKAQLPG